MRAGDLRHRVTIQSATHTVNAIGERVPAWGDVATVWAGIRPASAKEIEVHGAATHQVTHAITVRWTPELRADRRLVFGARVFNIVGVVNVEERNVELRVIASETSSGVAT